MDALIHRFHAADQPAWRHAAGALRIIAARIIGKAATAPAAWRATSP